MNQSAEMVKIAAKALEDKKAEDIRVIVHIFSKEDRLFYDLERMWTDGKQIDVNQL